MSIDIYTKQEEPTWKKVLLLISIVFFVIILGIFIYQTLIKIPNNEKHISNLNTQIASQGNEKQLENKEIVLTAEKKIKTFQDLYNNSPVFQEFFTVFESWIYPRVYFTEFNLNISDSKLEMSGDTNSLQSLMQQMIIFDEKTDILNYEISNIENGANGVTFNVSIEVNPELFKKKQDNNLNQNVE